MVGKNEYLEKRSIYPAKLPYYELIFHFSGKSFFKFNGKIYQRVKNTICFLPKGDNKEYIVEREEFGECIDIFFDTNIPISSEAFTITPQNAFAISQLFKKLFSVWVAKREGYYFKCISLLYDIFSELQKTNYIPDDQYNVIKPAIKYINDNFTNKKIHVSKLSETCNISQSYFKKLFIKKFGVPPSKYIIQLKINYACDLLRSNLYTITQIAQLCGYENIYFFSRQFKEYMGISPTDYINKYKSSR